MTPRDKNRPTKWYTAEDLVTRRYPLESTYTLTNYLTKAQANVQTVQRWGLNELRNRPRPFNELSADFTKWKNSRPELYQTPDTFLRRSLEDVTTATRIKPASQISLKLNPYDIRRTRDGIQLPRFGSVKTKRKIDANLVDWQNVRLVPKGGAWGLVITGHVRYEVVRMVQDLSYNASDWGADWGLGKFWTFATHDRVFVIPNPLTNPIVTDKWLTLDKTRERLQHKETYTSNPNGRGIERAKKAVVKARRDYVLTASKAVVAGFELFIRTNPVDAITFESQDFTALSKAAAPGFERAQIRLYREVYKEAFKGINAKIRREHIQKTYAPSSFPSSNIFPKCLKGTEIGRADTFECHFCGHRQQRDINAAQVLRLWGYHSRHNEEPAKRIDALDDFTKGLINAPENKVYLIPGGFRERQQKEKKRVNRPLPSDQSVKSGSPL